MSAYSVIATVLAYFAAMFAISWVSSRNNDNSGFFNGGRKAPWWLVAIAMIGAPMSGVTFVSVPGMVGGGTGMGYMQMVLGFFVGYLVIAFVLTPVFFRMNMVSIYQYLDERFGMSSHKTGAWFFFISKILGAAVRLFLVCVTLQLMVFGPLGLPFIVNVLVCMGIVLVYTFRGGVKSVIWTDALKTICMIVSIVLAMVFISRNLGMDFKAMAGAIRDSSYSRIFFFDDVNHPEYFWKQFLAGVFTVIAMTGLDQDMMQRTLSSRNARDSRKNLITSGLLQIPVIFLFLCLGALLHMFADANGIAQTGDRLFPAVATSPLLPSVVGVLFTIGLVSCAFSAGGSALTALTTSFTVDIIGTKGKSEEEVSALRKKVHLGMALLMGIAIFMFHLLGTDSVIDAVYKLASYTYGPILGMFVFGLCCRKQVRDRFVPIVAVAAPVLSFILQANSERWFGGYQFSYELLLVNAGLTVLGLCLLIVRGKEARK
ncbi:MAG: sodium:solute symporter [Bacteroidales bacterium]|nr:sodium:solute symporter [Bacteroidales bacterium]MDD5915557.1 sodium:solute symporter [Bacteroidales bacterium]MDD6828656.1 sodium:solute symporter [Bacteroidales bacterium]